MPSKPKRPLEEFAAEVRAKKVARCWVCEIPERDDLEKNYAQGVPVGTLIRWLIEECGYSRQDATPGKFQNHFYRSKHHDKA